MFGIRCGSSRHVVQSIAVAAAYDLSSVFGREGFEAFSGASYSRHGPSGSLPFAKRCHGIHRWCKPRDRSCVPRVCLRAAMTGSMQWTRNYWGTCDVQSGTSLMQLEKRSCRRRVPPDRGLPESRCERRSATVHRSSSAPQRFRACPRAAFRRTPFCMRSWPASARRFPYARPGRSRSSPAGRSHSW